jgi:hypothetical protein
MTQKKETKQPEPKKPAKKLIDTKTAKINY